MKRIVRKDISNKLKVLSKEYIDEQSSMVLTKLLDLPQFKSCNTLSVYLSMGGEVNTNEILRKSFELNRRVFIPKIIGKMSEDMFMLEVSGLDTINSFAKNNWGIPEPSMDIIEASKDGTYSGEIDLVLLPGVAFDKNCNRLGHGKGYYDCFIDRLTRANAEQGRAAPFLLALALDEQIIDSVPIENHDKKLDAILTPTTMYTKQV